MSNDLLKLATVPVLVLLNGFFVAAEYALVNIRPTRVDELVESGNRMAALVKKAKADPNRYISATQLGITMTSLGLGWVAEPTLAPLIRPAFGFLPAEGAVITSLLVAGILAYLLITLLHIVVGEQVPKMLALQRTEATALASVLPMGWIAVVFRPMVALLYWLTAAALRALGLKWEGEHGLVYSENELKMLVLASQEKGVIEESEQEMISRVFGFADVLAEQVMVPRTEMAALSRDATLDEVTKTIAETGHARYAVYGENLDDILGIFYVKDLYRFLYRGQRSQFSLTRLMRPPLVVAFTMPLDDLLTHMKRERTHIAIVVDEYGGTAGMVTLEDILERIVGDVQDEFEKPETDVQTLENGDAVISGLLSIEDVNERFDLDLDEPYYNTIGGYVFGQLGRRPEIGDEVRIDGHVLRVDQLDGLRIDRLLLQKAADADADDAESFPYDVVES